MLTLLFSTTPPPSSQYVTCLTYLPISIIFLWYFLPKSTAVLIHSSVNAILTLEFIFTHISADMLLNYIQCTSYNNNENSLSSFPFFAKSWQTFFGYWHKPLVHSVAKLILMQRFKCCTTDYWCKTMKLISITFVISNPWNFRSC